MIYRFEPILKSTIWGGERIASFKGLEVEDKTVGESWEISGVKGNVSVVADGPDAGMSLNDLIDRDPDGILGHKNHERFGKEFPLLIKFIDARADLSIQVHPDDRLAEARHNSKGKTEMWYVIDATDDAHLRSGLSAQLDPEKYVKVVEDNTICDYLTDYNVTPGNVFFLPAGRIHSIGAGCFIAEIQQTSDITYRIYDFNRRDAKGNLRQLHTQEAKDAIDYTVLPDYRTDYKENDNALNPLVDCPYFNVALLDVDRDHTVELADVDSFTIIIGVEGSVEVTADGCTATVEAGRTVLIPASAAHIAVRGLSDKARAITARIEE